MKRAIKKTKLALMVVIALAFVYSAVISVCADTQSSMPKSVSIDSDKFLFINTHTNKNGVGEVDGFMYIDFPTYSYNSETQILLSRVPVKNFDDTTKLIMGTGLSISGTAGSGAATSLTAYSTTYNEDSFYVDPDYTIHIFYGNEWATVKVGETWEKVVEEKSPVGTGKYVFTYTVKNFGLLDKSNFHQPTPEPTPTSVPTVTPTPTNTPTPTPTPNLRKISGFIASDITGINDHSGFKVEIENYSVSAYTDKNGFFSFKSINIPSGQCTIIISKPGYLTRKIHLNITYEDLEFGSEIDPVVMLSGDANNDSAVNMSDAVLIARLFNKTPSDSTFNPAADFNMDGVINVADVMCVAKNFNITADSYKEPTIYRSYYIDAIPGEEICIPLSEGGIAGITYRFAIEDEELVSFISKASQSVPYPDALIETYWTFKALKPGKTTIIFTSRFFQYKFYVNILD
ncbi:MAG TPA: dockerin type I domain-containing protein [Pseudobacteroides sp.]|nr:dockerin type I domain-containing protein [Pseudobacteroides sp.]